MDPKDIIQKYRKLGYAQILPALVCLIFIIWASIIIIIFTLDPPLYGRNTNDSPSTDNLILLGIFLIISISIIFGLISFLISSYQFIKSKKHSDYKLIVKGMLHLNRAWTMLLVFSVIMVSILCYVLYSYMTYRYF